GDPRPSRIPTRPASRTSITSSRLEEELSLQCDSLKADCLSESPERKERPLQEPSITSFRGSTALLVELEDKVAQAAANVQSAQSQVRMKQVAGGAQQGFKSGSSNQVDMFVRNSLYRGSLTQRNPVAKPKGRAPSAVGGHPVVPGDTKGSLLTRHSCYLGKIIRSVKQTFRISSVSRAFRFYKLWGFSCSLMRTLIPDPGSTFLPLWASNVLNSLVF
ncbi:hypothetical protein XENOCAPTIV_003706, partial [Xenoophorus captivus]